VKHNLERSTFNQKNQTAQPWQRRMSHFEGCIKKKSLTPLCITLLQKLVYDYYTSNGRDLPWRKTTDPYHILVSEIMLQQTQVDRVLTKYREFISAFPDFASLARAPLRTILQVWQGMGYNRRALALRKIAHIVVRRFKGKLPSDIETLTTLPGIGSATASAIAAFAFNKPVVFVETNIRTVFLYLFFRNRQHIKDADLLPLVEKTLDRANPRVWYHALMDFGAMLKKTQRNPGRQSAHYTKQSSFEGSDRQIRGMILRALTDTARLSESQLIRVIAAQPKRVRRILCQLQEEQFIRKKGTTYTIA
jgi:A/G-specific adenine glycosylase